MLAHPRPIVVAAPDSFKGSCSAADAAAALARGARQVFGDAVEVREIPLADGGEGTLDAMLAAWGVPARTVTAADALGRPRAARWGLSADGRTAVIEAAEANGLPHVADLAASPLTADSAGVGAIALAAIAAGAEEILLCIGGSASSDGGTGLLRALGARFLDADGAEVPAGAAGLARIATVDTAGLSPAARATRWRIAVDVTNPLCGPAGAAAVFGPQKGAAPADVAAIDAGLAALAGVLAGRAGVPIAAYRDRPGFGSAGGLPLATVALLGAETLAGADLVSAALNLPTALAGASLVLTGEGRLDSQSLGGKVVDLVRRTAPAGVPVVVIAGTVALSAAECRAAGLSAAFSIARGAAELPELLTGAPALIEDAAAHACAALALPAVAGG